MSVLQVNKEFYNKLYRRKNPLISIIHSFISFDQQSKSKINYIALKNVLKERFDKTLTILDYGFGHGSLLLKYSKRHKLFGCDISVEAIYNFPRVAKLVGKEIITASVDNFHSKFSNVRFDVITLSHIIEHVDDDLKLVKGLAEKLSDTGIVLINVPINEVWQDPKHVRKYSIKYIEGLMEKANLKILSIFETDKLTSFFLIEEKVRNAGILKLYFLKILRAIFAVIPLKLLQLFERTFLKGHQHQQLIVIAIGK